LISLVKVLRYNRSSNFSNDWEDLDYLGEYALELEVKARVGKNYVVIIPKRIADKVGLKEEMAVKISVREDEIIIKPVVDVIELSMKRKKIAKISLEELEVNSTELQKKYIK